MFPFGLFAYTPLQKPQISKHVKISAEVRLKPLKVFFLFYPGLCFSALFLFLRKTPCKDIGPENKRSQRCEAVFCYNIARYCQNPPVDFHEQPKFTIF